MSGPKRILIVDDEQDIRTYLSTLLGDQGYETSEARDGGEALQMVQEGAPDLITLDISMPGKSGMRAVAPVATMTAARAWASTSRGVNRPFRCPYADHTS